MKIRSTRARLAVLAHLAAAATPALSQTSEAPQTPVLKEVVVTATRHASRADELLSDVTVITRDEIENGTGRTVTELLSRLAGLAMSSNGGLGKASSVFIRGTESRHALLLVDGVRLGSATLGSSNFDTIPLEMIERIEVLKGPASALYGSDAVGGVIQIFTRKGKEGVHPYASVTVGEADRGEVAAGVSGASGAVRYAIGVQRLSEKGFSATNERAPFGGFNPDSDGFSQSSVNASMNWQLGNDWGVAVSALQTDGANQYDNGAGVLDVRTDFSTSVLNLGLDGRLASNWRSKLSVGQSSDKSLNKASNTSDRFDTEQTLLTWQNDVDTPLGIVVAGLENAQQKVNSTTAYTVSSRSIDSLFVGLNGDAGAHSWQVNARRDENSQFGGASTGLLAYGYRWSPALRARAAIGTSFKAPSFNALYFPGFGNPTTQPETGRSSELGLAYLLGAHQLSVTYFVNRIQGFITTQPTVSNIPYAKIEGWTLAADGAQGAFSYHSAIDLLDARNELTNLKLARRPDVQWTTSVNYAVGQWKLGGSLLAASDSFDSANNKQALGGYGTVDAHARYAVDKDWSVEGRLVNLGDKFYQTAQGYNQPGRSAYITLRYAPQ